jgi:hypothetical protein
VVRILTAVVGACLVLASPIVLGGCGGKGKPTVAPTTTVRHSRPLPANAIRIEWKKQALVPAPRAGRLCIVTYKTGHFCARYVFGQIPADAMKRKLRASGWVVAPSK